MWKRTAAIVISLVVSAGFIWLAMRGIPLDEVWADIRGANVPLLILTLLIGLVAIYTRGIRWQGLVDFQISRNRAFYIVGIMMLLNLFLRLGEVARTILARREKVPVVTAATSIVVERLLDTLFVLVVLGLVISRVPNMPEAVQQNIATIAPIFTALTILGFGVLILLARYPKVAHRILDAITSRITILQRLPLTDLLDHLLLGLKPLVNPARFTHAIVWSIISWGLSYIMFMLVQLALGVPDNLWLQSGLSMSLASFSVALPSIGAIGPFETAVIVAGRAFGVADSTGLAIGVVVHVITIIVYAITGIWGFVGMGVQLGDVVKSEPDAAPTESAEVSKEVV
ncbi:MAG: lysylphosphatidylglycerol synthase transmembrane domain-containing protein [Chloroflexota bacterium]